MRHGLSNGNCGLRSGRRKGRAVALVDWLTEQNVVRWKAVFGAVAMDSLCWKSKLNLATSAGDVSSVYQNMRHNDSDACYNSS
jgi:hypothetical protein